MGALSMNPLSFKSDELDALLLGLLWIRNDEASELRPAAGGAIKRIVAALAAPSAEIDNANDRERRLTLTATLRRAIDCERMLDLHYKDKHGVASSRTVWPVTLDFFGSAEVLVAWCELREEFRHFRLDRIVSARVLANVYPQRRRLLLAKWRLERLACGDSF